MLLIQFLEILNSGRGRPQLLVDPAWIPLIWIKRGKVKDWHIFFALILVLAQLVLDGVRRRWYELRAHKLPLFSFQMLLLHLEVPSGPDLFVKFQWDVWGFAVDFGLRVQRVTYNADRSIVAKFIWVVFRLAAAAVTLVEVWRYCKLVRLDL